MSFWREFPLDDRTGRVLLTAAIVGLLIVLVYQVGLPRGWWG